MRAAKAGEAHEKEAGCPVNVGWTHKFPLKNEGQTALHMREMHRESKHEACEEYGRRSLTKNNSIGTCCLTTASGEFLPRSSSASTAGRCLETGTSRTSTGIYMRESRALGAKSRGSGCFWFSGVGLRRTWEERRDPDTIYYHHVFLFFRRECVPGVVRGAPSEYLVKKSERVQSLSLAEMRW